MIPFAREAGPAAYYTPQFRVVLEDHMTFLREHPNRSILKVENQVAYKFAGDLFGMLTHYEVEEQFQWIIMRMNHLTSPTDFREGMEVFIIPPFDVIERLRNVHMTQSKLKK